MDRGAQVNTLPLCVVHHMFPEEFSKKHPPHMKVLHPIANVKITACNRTPFNCIGTVHIPCKLKQSPWVDTRFFVVDVPGPAILGLPSCDIINVVTLHCAIQQQQPMFNSVEDILTAHPQQFDQIGEF